MEKNSTVNSFYFPRLDGMRFLAFLLVFFHHFPSCDFRPDKLVSKYGWSGVELFFVLSSFLLTRLIKREIEKTGGISYKKFYLRRILRIWPLYFFYILLILSVFGLAKPPDSVSYGRILGLFTFTDNLWSSVSGNNTALHYVAHLWTISLEEQFYLFLPFVVPVLLKMRKKSQNAAFIFSWSFLIISRIISVLLHYSHPFIYVLPIQGDAFLFGTFMGIGYFDNVLKKLNREVEILLGLACLAVSWSIPPITVLGYAMVVSYCFLAIGFSLLMDGINNSNLRIISFAFGDRLIRYLGKISFGLYVYHIAVFSIALNRYRGGSIRQMLRF